MRKKKEGKITKNRWSRTKKNCFEIQQLNLIDDDDGQGKFSSKKTAAAK